MVLWFWCPAQPYWSVPCPGRSALWGSLIETVWNILGEKSTAEWDGEKKATYSNMPWNTPNYKLMTLAVRITFGCCVDVFSNWFLPKFRYPSPSDLDFIDGMASEAGKARVVLWKINENHISHDDLILWRLLETNMYFNNVMTLAFYVAPWYLAESKALKWYVLAEWQVACDKLLTLLFATKQESIGIFANSCRLSDAAACMKTFWRACVRESVWWKVTCAFEESLDSSKL